MPVVQPDPDDGGRDAWGDWVTFSPSQITAHDDALFRVRGTSDMGTCEMVFVCTLSMRRHRYLCATHVLCCKKNIYVFARPF